jgi:hypothetical protein
VALHIPSTELLGNLKSRHCHFLSNSLFCHHSIFRLCVALPLEGIANKLRMPNKSDVKTTGIHYYEGFKGPTLSLAGQFLQSTWSLFGIYSVLTFCSLFSFLDFNRIPLPNLYE